MDKKADLRRWLKEEWVDISRKDKSGKHPPCGRSKASTGGGYPKCRPSKKVSKDTPTTSKGMSKKTKEKAVKQKREAEKKPRKDKKPHMTSHESSKKSKSDELLIKMSKHDWLRIGISSNWLQKEALDEEDQNLMDMISNSPPVIKKNVSFATIGKVANEVKENIEQLLFFSESFKDYANVGTDDPQTRQSFEKFLGNLWDMRGLLNTMSVIETQKYEPDLMDVPKYRDKIFNREKDTALSMCNIGISHLDILQDLLKIAGQNMPSTMKKFRTVFVRSRSVLE